MTTKRAFRPQAKVEEYLRMQRERGFAVKAVIGESRGYRNPYFLEVRTVLPTGVPGFGTDVPLTRAGNTGTSFASQGTPIVGLSGMNGNFSVNASSV